MDFNRFALGSQGELLRPRHSTPISAMPGSMASLSRYTISALHYGLLVLETFLEVDRRTQSVADITGVTGLTKSRVFRILRTLEEHEFVVRDPVTNYYSLNSRIVAFAEAVSQNLDLVQLANPILDELFEQSGETVHLSVLDHQQSVCVARRESHHSLRLHAQVGKAITLHAGGAPKVLLAYLPADERREIIRNASLRRITDRTITDPERLEEVLAQIRRDGYTVSVGEVDIGAHSVAAPVRNHRNKVIAAISIAGPSQRFSPAKVALFIDMVCSAADLLSRRLGWTESSGQGR